MKIVRRITYEAADNEYETGVSAEERLREQLRLSLALGTYPLLTTITVEHLEGPQWETDGKQSGVNRMQMLNDIRQVAVKLANRWQDWAAADSGFRAPTPSWHAEIHELLDLLAAYDNTFRRRPR